MDILLNHDKSSRKPAFTTCLLFGLLLAACCLWALPSDAEEFNLRIAGQETRSEVIFPHGLHMDYFDCFDCHHDYNEAGENVLDDYALDYGNPDILCGACHNQQSDIFNQQKAYHRQCMGCHEKYTFTKRPTGPLLCGECHIKNENNNKNNNTDNSE